MGTRPLLALCLVLAGCRSAPYRTREVTRVGEGGPRILCVVAHPDDETAFAGTLYKAATHLGAACDVALITNGEGGYKYSTLAERVYGLALCDERVGRAKLPRIREAEMLAALRLLGARRLFLFDEEDHRYTLDPLEVLGEGARVWRLERIERGLAQILRRGRYDFVLVLAPQALTHGHHQAAAVLALRALAALPEEQRAVPLAARAALAGERLPAAAPLAGFPETRLAPGEELVFDRRQAFGYRGRLDYRIVVNWVIAAHKSQGTMQLAVNGADEERFQVFALAPLGGTERARSLFERLAEPQFPELAYDEAPLATR